MTRTTAQLVALVFGIVFILVAVLGFITPGGLSMGTEHAPMLLGMFAVNLLHNVVHLLFGLAGVAAARSFAGARSYCRAVGVIYLVLAGLGLVAPTTFGLIPIGGSDIYLHLVLGLVLAAVGFTAKAPATNS
jgi:hypothetical protein